MSAACYIKSDLSIVRPVGDGATSGWTAQPIADEDRDSSRVYVDRASQAAAWYAAQPSHKRRLSTLVVDVDESLCFFVRTPSLARPVLAASVRQNGQDWGDWNPTAGIEPLTDLDTASGTVSGLFQRKPRSANAGPRPMPGSTPSESGIGVAVITQTDSLARLMLESLDVRGVRVDSVMSLWHAMAAVWGDSGNDPSIIVLAEPKRLVWAWAQGHDLLCGGAAAIEETREPPAGAEGQPPPPHTDPMESTLRRMTLDWLSWAAQLSITPERIVVVGQGTSAIAAELSKRWNNVESRAIEEKDPIAVATLGACDAGQRAARASHPSGRTCLTRLTARPTHAMRTRFALRALAIALLGAAAFGAGRKLSAAANTTQDLAQAMREQSRKAVEQTIPTLKPEPNEVLSRLVDSQLAELDKATKGFQPPPPPPKIFEEYQRVSDLLAKHEGVKIQRISLESRGAELSITVPERSVGEAITDELRQSGAAVEWQIRRDASVGFTSLAFMGSWKS